MKYIHDALRISPKSFKKEWQRITLKKEIDGIAFAASEEEERQVNFWTEMKEGEFFLHLALGSQTTVVSLYEIFLNHGIRFVFVCPNCGKHHHYLYFYEKAGRWLCRKCSHLKYESFNVNSDAGYIFYKGKYMEKFRRLMKAIGHRYFRNKEPVKKLISALKAAEKAGLFEEIKAINKMICMVKNDGKMPEDEAELYNPNFFKFI